MFARCVRRVSGRRFTNGGKPKERNGCTSTEHWLRITRVLLHEPSRETGYTLLLDIASLDYRIISLETPKGLVHSFYWASLENKLFALRSKLSCEQRKELESAL